MMSLNTANRFAPVATINGKGVFTQSVADALKKSDRIKDAHIRIWTREGRVVPDHCDVTGHDGVIYCRVLSEENETGMQWMNAATKVNVKDADLVKALDEQWAAENHNVMPIIDRAILDESTPVEPKETVRVNRGPAQPTNGNGTGELSVAEQVAAALAKLLPGGVPQTNTNTRQTNTNTRQSGGRGNGRQTRQTGRGKGQQSANRRQRPEHVPDPSIEFKTITGRNGDFRKLVIDDGRTYNPMFHAQLSARHCLMILANVDEFMDMVRELAMEADADE
jgi:hypothetical protein